MVAVILLALLAALVSGSSLALEAKTARLPAGVTAVFVAASIWRTGYQGVCRVWDYAESHP